MTISAHSDLEVLRDRLRNLYNAMSTFGSTQFAVKPPILDSSIDLSGGDVSEEFHSHQDVVHGLRALKDSVKRDLDVLEKFLDDPQSASKPALSTNAPYLISVWNEVLHAPPPIVTIMRTVVEGSQTVHVPRRGSRKPPGVKIDVVADGGRRWIRVNTTKNSRLLSEFREIDSYLTDSDEEGDKDGRPSLAQREFDNSILKMGRSLLDAARQNPVSGTTTVPSVTLRLTRLDPSSSNPREQDPRIAQTIDTLRDMGITVELGEHDPALLPKVIPAPVRRLEPTVHVNLDLSILIALVSDITHAPLPDTVAEADARYIPAAQSREWKRKRLEAGKSADSNGNPGQGQGADTEVDEAGKHSRALANQALQEMTRGLLHELHDRLAAVDPGAPANVEFWTTPEARDRCLRIVLSKIGGPQEKRRAAALFPGPDVSTDTAEEQYWAGSRYPRAFLPLVPIRVFETSVPGPGTEEEQSGPKEEAHSPFSALLERTCRGILVQETIPNPNARPWASPPPVPASPNQNQGESEGGSRGGDRAGAQAQAEIEPAAVTRANPRLTAHTVQSMLWGAARGWTTLTANKASVRAILRELRAAEGGYGQVSGAGATADADVAGEQEGDEEEENEVIEKAAMWVVDPRSLAEAMRADYVEAVE